MNDWMCNNFLQLNKDKAEIKSKVRDLGVIMDSDLTLNGYIHS